MGYPEGSQSENILDWFKEQYDTGNKNAKQENE